MPTAKQKGNSACDEHGPWSSYAAIKVGLKSCSCFADRRRGNSIRGARIAMLYQELVAGLPSPPGLASFIILVCWHCTIPCPSYTCLHDEHLLSGFSSVCVQRASAPRAQKVYLPFVWHLRSYHIGSVLVRCPCGNNHLLTPPDKRLDCTCFFGSNAAFLL